MSTTAIAARRPKWHPIPPPLPSPKILNLPRRNRHLKQPIKPTRKPSSSTSKSLSLSHHCSLLDLHQNYYYDDRKENLERLFGQERGLSRNDCTNVPVVLLNSSASSFSSSLSGGRREKVKEEEGEGMCGESSESVEEKWKFQAEILRAECNFLRMDREVALEKLDKNRLQMERTLRSAVQTVEMLRRKMDELSKEMLQRIEEDFGSILSTAANSYLDSSASTSKRIEDPESAFSSRQLCQESTSHEDTKCTGRCKIIVRRIVDQVRAETEQWSQMQGMLGKVRVEMEDLQDSRKFWEDRALNSDHEVQCLQSSVQEWKEKALTLETKANELEKELSALKGELEKLKPAQCIEQSRTVINKQNLSLAYIWKEQENHTADKECKEETARDKSAEQNSEFVPTTDSLPLSLGKQL